MKKGLRKLSLHRETLLSLNDQALTEAAGGASIFCPSVSLCHIGPTPPAATCGGGD
jgi:hypothetical protein